MSSYLACCPVDATTYASLVLALCAQDRAASPAPTSTSIGSFRRRSTRTDAECITFLHGYPTSSYDYYQVVQRLLKQTDFKAKLLLIDMLGYGDSDKGVGQARFSIQQHANVVCSIWQR